MVKETPILFSTPMIQAIMEGRKTQTRRVLKLKHMKGFENEIASIHKDGSGTGWIAWSPKPVSEETVKLYPNNEGFKCPFGKVGDLLWVRETFKPKQFAGERLNGFDYKADHVTWLESMGEKFTKNSGCEVECGKGVIEHWKPSLFMPKSAARIWLEITDIKVEKIINISISFRVLSTNGKPV